MPTWSCSGGPRLSHEPPPAGGPTQSGQRTAAGQGAAVSWRSGAGRTCSYHPAMDPETPTAVDDTGADPEPDEELVEEELLVEEISIDGMCGVY